MSSNIIYLFPNIFLSKINNIKLKDINDNNITKIITIKNKSEILNKYNDNIKIEQVEINKENIYFNFDLMYNTIDKYIKNNERVILCDDDFDLILILIISFFSKKNNLSFYKCTKLFSVKTNTKIENINKSYLEQLFYFHQKN